MKDTLLVTDIFPPAIGGPATFIDQLGHQLARDGQLVTVVCTSAQAQNPSDRERPFRVRRILRRPPSLLQSLLVRAVLAQEILRHRRVFTNGLEYPTFQICSLLRRKYVLKVVGDSAWETARNTGLTTLSIDEFQTTPPEGKVWEKLVRKRSLFACHAWKVITPSEYLRRIVIGWGVAPERVVTVPNGIPLDEFAPYRPRRRESHVLKVVFVGRLANWKGVDTLLKAVACLQDVHVTIVGDGPEMSSLRALTHELKLEDVVTFAGQQARSAVLAYMAQANVMVLVSSYEGLSHTLLEACALGVPCIASDRGGNPEVIRHGENGLLVPYGDVQQLRAALARLQADEEQRYRLACNAKEASRYFDFETTVRQTAQVLLPS
jgi:glycosyltransferase involved in cell wall biosynthesis